MTPMELQDAIIRDGEKILEGMEFHNADGTTKIGVKGYAQALPNIQEEEFDQTQYFPYFIVRLVDGDTQNDESPWKVTVNILFGHYDPDLDSQGHRRILIMMERFINRYAAEPLLEKTFRADPKIEWQLQDEDTYPFYFGGIEMKFTFPKINRRDPFLC